MSVGGTEQPTDTGPPDGTGRVALVTGGSGCVGAAVVRHLAARGFAVAIHCHGSLAEARALAATLEAAGRRALAVTANLRDDGPVRAMVHRVTDHFGRIDVLVTAAGIARRGPLEAVTADDLRAHFDVNVVGAFVCAQEVGAVMAGQETGGTIVLVAPAGAARPAPEEAALAPSRGAIPALARSLAVEFARRHPGIRVNAVLPGAVAGGAAPATGTPVDRPGTAGHVARAVLFLVGSSPVTGVCLSLDGGLTIPDGPAEPP